MKRLGIAVAALLLLAQRLPAQAPPDSVRIARAREAVRARLDSIPGIAVAVLEDGRIIWSEGFGWADLEQRVPVTTGTEFRIGSISKSLTSAAVGLLVQDGKLDLDAPVQRYVPSFPVKPWPITTRLVAPELQIMGGVDFTHATAAQDAEDLVAAERRSDLRRRLQWRLPGGIIQHQCHFLQDFGIGLDAGEE